MMANYIAKARSNHIRVTDVEAFKARMEELDCKVEIGNSKGTVAVWADTPSGAWPTSLWPEADDEPTDINIVDEISKFLVDGEICILMEVGNEKMRYLVGQAFAFRKGDDRFIEINLYDIYAKAATELGVHEDSITKCEY